MSSLTTKHLVGEPSSPKYIFVIGGPGAGKGTQCSSLVKRYGFSHLSLGDILRAETANPDSKWAGIIRRNMQEGVVGSMEMTVDLLNNAIKNLGDRPKYVLIDGRVNHHFDNLRRYTDVSR
jgi:UMP-CMP kinase